MAPRSSSLSPASTPTPVAPAAASSCSSPLTAVRAPLPAASAWASGAAVFRRDLASPVLRHLHLVRARVYAVLAVAVPQGLAGRTRGLVTVFAEPSEKPLYVLALAGLALGFLLRTQAVLVAVAVGGWRRRLAVGASAAAV